MGKLLEALQGSGFEPVGVTHNGDPDVPLSAPYGVMALEVYFVDSDHGSLPDGRFGTPRPLGKLDVFDLLAPPSLAIYSSRIHAVNDHPQGWAGHELVIRGSFSGAEALEFRTAAGEFNERRRLQRAQGGIGR